MTKQYRTCLWTWILFGVLCLLPYVIVWCDWGQGRILRDLAVPMIVSVMVIVWLTGFRITITPTELRLRDCYITQNIRRDQIKKVWLKKVQNTRGLASPRLVVEPRAGSGAKEMSINAKVFSKAAVIAILDLRKQVAEADDGGLLDGIVIKKSRSTKERAAASHVDPPPSPS